MELRDWELCTCTESATLPPPLPSLCGVRNQKRCFRGVWGAKQCKIRTSLDYNLIQIVIVLMETIPVHGKVKGDDFYS